MMLFKTKRMIKKLEAIEAEVIKQQATLKQYREALEFYADRRIYVSFPGDNDTAEIERDEGHKARQALNIIKEKARLKQGKPWGLS